MKVCELDLLLFLYKIFHNLDDREFFLSFFEIYDGVFRSITSIRNFHQS